MWKTKGFRYKFKNSPVKRNGIRFASKLEDRFYAHLEQLKINGEVSCFLYQVPIRLPGGTKYIVDFVVFFSDGVIRFIDTKGMQTDTFKIKKREIEAVYPFEIEIVGKGDF